MEKFFGVLSALTFLFVTNSVAQKVDYSVVSVNAESSLNLKKITSDDDYVCMPQIIRKSSYIDWLSNKILDISPDGTSLAYLSFRNNATNIFIKDLNIQRGATQRTNRNKVLDFSYSPDGNKICFTEMVDKVNRIFVTDASKGYVCRQITSNEMDYTPVFSTNMSDIFFSRMQGNGLSIWSYNMSDNLLSSITNGMNPCPINGENAILCVRPSGVGLYEVWKVNLDTGIEECIVSDGSHSFTTPSVSPDGKWILLVGSSKVIVEYKDWPDETFWNTDIYVCRTDGSELTQLTYHAADDISPVWSRDGKYIYFISQRGSSTGTANVWQMSFNPAGL